MRKILLDFSHQDIFLRFINIELNIKKLQIALRNFTNLVLNRLFRDSEDAKISDFLNKLRDLSFKISLAILLGDKVTIFRSSIGVNFLIRLQSPTSFAILFISFSLSKNSKHFDFIKKAPFN